MIGIAGHARRSVGLVYVDEAVAQWLEHQAGHCSAAYVRQCEAVLGQLIAATPQRMPVAALTTRHIAAMLEAAAGRGLAHKSLSDYRRVLSSFCSWAVDKGLAKRNIAQDTALPRGRPSPPPKYLPPEWVPPYLAAAQREYRPIATMAILAGLRRVEIVGLRWSDVYPDRLRVLCAKKRQPVVREIPLHPRLASELLAVERISEWVFPIRKEGQGLAVGDQRSVDTKWFAQQNRYTLERLGLPAGSVTFHGLRSTFATLAQNVCGDAWLVGQLLGHSEGATRGREGTVTHLYIQAEWRRMVDTIEGIDVDRLRPVRKVGL